MLTQTNECNSPPQKRRHGPRRRTVHDKLMDRTVASSKRPTYFVETFNNGADAMGTMNFSIPDEVKEAFNAEFDGQNKSAVVAELMRKAVEERRARAKADAQFDTLFEELLRQRAEDPPMTDDEIRQARQEGRP